MLMMVFIVDIGNHLAIARCQCSRCERDSWELTGEGWRSSIASAMATGPFSGGARNPRFHRLDPVLVLSPAPVRPSLVIFRMRSVRAL